MADARTIAGVESFTVSRDGAPTTKFHVAGTATVQATGVEREALVGATGVAGFKERPVVEFIEVECYHRGDISLAEMASWRDVTGTLVEKGGKLFVANGWLVGAPELNTIEGTFTVRIEGKVKEVRR